MTTVTQLNTLPLLFSTDRPCRSRRATEYARADAAGQMEIRVQVTLTSALK